jgi:hypothetical protein
MDKRLIAGLLSAAALAVPATAAADRGHGEGHGHGHSKTKHERSGNGKRAKKVMFVFKGSFTAPGTVAVASGNAHARKGGFVGQSVSFDLSAARIVASDRNGDSKVDLSDVKDGDLVLIQARLAKRTEFAAAADPVVARKLVDRSGDDEDEDETEPGEDPAT